MVLLVKAVDTVLMDTCWHCGERCSWKSPAPGCPVTGNPLVGHLLLLVFVLLLETYCCCGYPVAGNCCWEL